MSAATLAGAQLVIADNDKGRGSPIGLFVVLVLCIAVYFLYKSLNRHIKRIPESFDSPTGTAPTDTTATGTAVSNAAPTDTEPVTAEGVPTSDPSHIGPHPAQVAPDAADVRPDDAPPS